MCAPSPDRVARRSRSSHLVTVVAAGLFLLSGATGLAACGSDQKGTDNGAEQQQVNDPKDAGSSTASFCGVAADVAAAKKINDTAAMASDLQLIVDDLPDGVADDVQAYIDGLEAAHPNEGQSKDSRENEDAERAYERYAEGRCADTDAASTTTTSS